MHGLVSFNSEIIKSEDASMSPVSVSGLYGKGVFTTIAIIDRKPFLFERHWHRLNENASRLGIEIEQVSHDSLIESLSALLQENKVGEGRARITLFDSSASAIWKSLTELKSSVLIQTADRRVRPKGLRLGISPFMVSSTAPLNNIKTCNYLEQTISYDAALRAGFDEAVRLNEKYQLVSACMANLFWVRDGKFFTPPVETGCLTGTTRSFIAEKWYVSLVEAGIEALSQADHVFLTSAGLGIAEVSEIAFDSGTRRFAPLPAGFYESYGLSEIKWVSAKSA